MMDLAAGDRPREKLLRHGPTTLGDNELVAVLLGHGTSGRSALQVGSALLRAAGGSHGLTRMSPDQMAQVPGIGPGQAARIAAGVELGRRTLLRDRGARPQFLSPDAAAAWLLPQYGALAVEQCGVLLLDTKHRLLRAQVVSVGSLDASVAHPRELLRLALAAGAAAVIVFHNHPSGDPTPSEDDVALTRRLMAAGAIVGVSVMDHLVLADNRYCSIRLALEAVACGR